MKGTRVGNFITEDEDKNHTHRYTLSNYNRKNKTNCYCCAVLCCVVEGCLKEDLCEMTNNISCIAILRKNSLYFPGTFYISGDELLVKESGLLDYEMEKEVIIFLTTTDNGHPPKSRQV